jgi:hypothetical protein
MTFDFNYASFFMFSSNLFCFFKENLSYVLNSTFSSNKQHDNILPCLDNSVSQLGKVSFGRRNLTLRSR